MIKEFIQSNNSFFIRELRRSIKNIEIEERMDLVLHRPIGLVISWMAIKLRLIPTHVSLLSLVAGVSGGVLFYWQNDWNLILWGCALVILSGLLDSADGQIARLTGNSSKLGMIIDGVIDNFVFMSIYIAGSLYLFPTYGLWVAPLALVSGLLHSTQSLLFEYHKNECSYYSGGDDSCRNQSPHEIRSKASSSVGIMEKLLYWIYMDYVRKQHVLVTRKGKIKERFEQLRKNSKTADEFSTEFKKRITPYLTYWALFGGTNTHRTLIILFCLYHRFDTYLVLNMLLTIPIVIVSRLQDREDSRLLLHFERKFRENDN